MFEWLRKRKETCFHLIKVDVVVTIVSHHHHQLLTLVLTTTLYYNSITFATSPSDKMLTQTLAALAFLAFGLVQGVAIEERAARQHRHRPGRIIVNNIPVCGGNTVAACCQTTATGDGAQCKQCVFASHESNCNKISCRHLPRQSLISQGIPYNLRTVRSHRFLLRRPNRKYSLMFPMVMQ